MRVFLRRLSLALPLLQLALDNRSLPDALRATRILAGEVDVREAGAILVCAEDLPLFAGLPIKVFITGRAIRDAADPAAAARVQSGDHETPGVKRQ
jgi:3-keto-L-gulonate-6-phosphate decarboxylase